jgi:peptidyl-tRNA hydrolase
VNFLRVINGLSNYQSGAAAGRHLCIMKINIKNIIMNPKFILVIAGIVFSIASFAASTSSLVVTSSKENVFNVHYKASKVGTVKVSILDAKNQVVYFEMLANTGSFIRPYNFSELTEGEYTIVVEGNGTKQAEKVTYQSAKVISFAMVSQVENQANKYLLSITNNGEETVTVRVLSEAGDVLHENTMEVKEAANVIYDLNQVKKSNATITFEISAQGSVLQTIHL